jgi:GNAT superfamily N-acetyltransferase
MFDINRMFQTEISFCDSFTSRMDTHYGRLYYNPQNPLSHDSNHAHIMKNLLHPEDTLQDIKAFFRKQGLTPRIYPSFVTGELEILRPYLVAAGFIIKTENARTFLFPPEVQMPLDSTVSVKRITRISSDVIELIHSEDKGDWTIKVLRRHDDDEKFHLLGLFEDGKCLSIASVKTMDGYSRVDDVLTHSNHRGKHFGTRLMEYLVNYHRTISENYLYIWATNPIAIDMYLRVGFMEISLS